MDLLKEKETVIGDSFWSFKGKYEYVDNLYLMGSPIPVGIIWTAYMLFVLKIGPSLMKNRAPFRLRRLLIVYNAIQVGISCWLVFRGSRFMLSHGVINSKCLIREPIIKEDLCISGYGYAMAKLTELLDTVFFVLRKKDNQVTFLHVYHHSMMALVPWLALKYDPSETCAFLGTLNSFVHIVMYAYYGLSAFPGLQKYLWWKKYITSMQLIQFVMIIIHAAIAHMVSECPPGYVIRYTIFGNAFLFLYLFGDFYIKSYSNKNKAKLNTNGTSNGAAKGAHPKGKVDIDAQNNNVTPKIPSKVQ